ncbi:MAG: universal stress protein [Halobacteriaceae archaeon]
MDADAPIDVDTVLAPVDGSDESAVAAEYAVAVADRYDATLYVVFVIGESVSRAIETGDLDADEVADSHRAFVGDVRGVAADHDVAMRASVAYGFSTTRKLQHPGSVILDTAEDVGADFIVVPRESMGADEGEVLEKAAEYVLLYASQPVLSV